MSDDQSFGRQHFVSQGYASAPRRYACDAWWAGHSVAWSTRGSANDMTPVTQLSFGRRTFCATRLCIVHRRSRLQSTVAIRDALWSAEIVHHRERGVGPKNIRNRPKRTHLECSMRHRQGSKRCVMQGFAHPVLENIRQMWNKHDAHNTRMVIKQRPLW